MSNFFKNKQLAAFISVLSNSFLIVLKLIAGFISGSVSIISEAIHSGSDLLASIITCVAVHESEKPADEKHPFGHGKYEDAAGFIEGVIIILAALYIIYEAARKLTGEIEPLNNSILGITVMSISVVANIAVSLYLFKVAKETDSIAVYSDAQHLNTDIFSSLTVLAGLLIIKYTGLHILDSLIAVIVAMVILQTGIKICKKTYDDLMDASLPDEEISLINSTIKKHFDNDNSAIKDIKTRKSGKRKENNITLLVDGNMTVKHAHDLCDNLEKEIENELGNTEITIHVEPSKALSCKKINK